MKRIISIDVVRGFVMAIMAIDHLRDLIHSGSLTQDPLNLQTTTPALFFTRLITHLCAPIFVFLSGTSAFISFKRKNNLKQSRRFLFTRGIWLVVLEFTIITFAVWWDVHFNIFLWQVIAAIGVSFIILSLLLKVPARILFLIGLAIVFTHDFIGPLIRQDHSWLATVFNPLLNFNVIPLFAKKILIVGYPVIPWLGIMLCGFGSASLFELEVSRRRKYFLLSGLGCLVIFLILRGFNIYGDPSPWSVQRNSMYTFLSFLNVSKYPPSLLYTLSTLGIMFLLLYIVEGFENGFTRVLQVFGQVPLFYYLLHWYLLHTIMFLVLFYEGFHVKDMFPSPSSFGRPVQPNGVGLVTLYLLWLSALILLYPVCKWYGKYKRSHPEKTWMSYL